MRAFLIVLDGLGVGAQSDAAAYGDDACDTLRDLRHAVPDLRLPALERLGLASHRGIRAESQGASGTLAMRSPGRDRLLAHRELAGEVAREAPPSYPGGAPSRLLDEVAERAGRGWMGNAASGPAELLARCGDEHARSRRVVVAVSPESLLFVAALEEVVSAPDLEHWARLARESFQGDHGVGRIATATWDRGSRLPRRRPRVLANAPGRPTLLDLLVARRIPTASVGDVADLFAGSGVTSALSTWGLHDDLEALADLARSLREGCVFASLLAEDADGDPRAYARALERFDARVGPILDRMRSDDLAVLTGCRGSRFAPEGRSATREAVPLLVAGRGVRTGAALGRGSLADVAATLSECFGVVPPAGRSLLGRLR